MQIEVAQIDTLNSAKYNPRKDLKPTDAEYIKLKNSVEHFGYVEPIIVNKRNMTVVGGHQRLKVLKDLGYKDIEVVYVDLNDTDEKALNIALNKISGDWDAEKLEDLLRDLSLSPDFDVELTGFTNEEIDKLFNGSLDDAKDTLDEIDDKEDKIEDTSDNNKVKECSSIYIGTVTLLGQTNDTIILKELDNNQVEKILKFVEKEGEDELVKRMVSIIE
jgi:ParB-like chromosome segregation protein Spo0J